MILDDGADGERILSYCTNVHPGESVNEIMDALDQHAVPVKARLAPDEPFALGLRLGQAAVDTLQQDRAVFERFRQFLEERDFFAYTLNVFPQGSFHDEVVKERVYRPDWTTEERADYTLEAARVLTRLLPPGETFGTLSTVPLGWAPDLVDQESVCAQRLLVLVGRLARLEEESGTRILVCLEPEPLCLIERTRQLIDFFETQLLAVAGALPPVAGRTGPEQVLRHLGACFDACHAAVEFEDPAYALEALSRAGIEVGKIQLSSALELRRPRENPEGLAALKSYQEPRFLHQVITQDRRGALTRHADLPDFFTALEETDLAPESARIHFHVPIHQSEIFPLDTTQSSLREVLHREARRRGVRHFEVETYTFSVLPAATAATSPLSESLVRELRFARDALLQPASPR